jgi:hypothetical protein
MKSSAQVSRKKKAATKKSVEKATTSKALSKKGKGPKQMATKSLSTKKMPIVARYLDDGKFALEMNYYDGNLMYTSYSGTGIDSSVEIDSTINQLVRLCKAREGSITKDEILIKLNASFSVFTGMQPKDSIEAMMITQMIALHEMALRESERALLKEQPDEFVEKHINRATKLCRSHASLVEAFNKYRTKGQQKITVQHVNVNDGGQAVIGDINQEGGNG